MPRACINDLDKADHFLSFKIYTEEKLFKSRTQHVKSSKDDELEKHEERKI